MRECLCSKPSTVQSEWTIPKTMDVVTYTFIALEMDIFYRNEYILYIQYIHTLHVHMSDSGTDIHYTEWGCQYPSTNPQEILCFKWNFLLDLRDVFQECNPGVGVLLELCQSFWQHSLPWHTHRSHCQDTRVMQNLNGCDMPLFMVAGDIQNQLAHKWYPFVVVKWNVFKRLCSVMNSFTL
jgi:hypothetical protein